MKIKLDENIPHSVRGSLGGRELDIDTVLDEGLGGRRDDDIWAAAQAEGRFLSPRTSTSRIGASSRRAHITAC